MLFTYQHNGQIYTLELERQPDGSYRAVIDGQAYAVQAQRISGAWQITLDGERHTVITAADGSERHLHTNGTALTLTVPDTRRRRGSAAGANDLTAQMPGQVRAVSVAAGEHVSSGQTLVILEAMKMEIRVTAPTDGTVTNVLVSAGDVVDRGQRLVEFAAE